MADLPETGDITLPACDLTSLNNGEKRIISQEAGLAWQRVMHAIQAVSGDDASILDITEFDIADVEYALGRIALRRAFGRDADTAENADRVVLKDDATGTPT